MDFSYHRKLSPIVGVILALALVETVVLHIVAMAYWGWKIALLIGLADISVIVMLAQLLRSFRTHPITVRNGLVTMQTGRKFSVAIPADDIVGFRSSWSLEELKAPSVLNMALAAWPTIVFDLRTPLARRRKSITTIAHCLDDPESFVRAVLATRRQTDPGSEVRLVADII
jgi:hypothetical protein